MRCSNDLPHSTLPNGTLPNGAPPLSQQPACVDSPTLPSHPSTSAAQTDFAWGLQQYHQGQFAKALKNFSSALHYYAQAQDWLGVGQSLNGLSATYLRLHQYERALTYGQAAVAVLDNLGADRDYALALYCLGVSHLRLQHWTWAQTYLEQALASYRGLADPIQEDWVLLHLGQLYAGRQEFLFALACYESVLDAVLARTPQCKPKPKTEALLVEVLALMVELCEVTHQSDLAILPYQDVLDRYIAAGCQQKAAMIFRQLGQFHESAGRYRLALDCYAQALQAVPPGGLE